MRPHNILCDEGNKLLYDLDHIRFGQSRDCSTEPAGLPPKIRTEYKHPSLVPRIYQTASPAPYPHEAFLSICVASTTPALLKLLSQLAYCPIDNSTCLLGGAGLGEDQNDGLELIKLLTFEWPDTVSRLYWANSNAITPV